MSEGTTYEYFIEQYLASPGNDKRIPVFNRLRELLDMYFTCFNIYRIEISCFNKTIDEAHNKNILKNWNNTSFTNIYCITTHRVIAHFDNLENESDLINRCIRDEDIFDKIAFMTSEELIPSKYSALKNELDERSKQKIEQKISTLYICPKCKERKSTIDEVQLRSLDEAANIIATCMSCRYRWKAY